MLVKPDGVLALIRTGRVPLQSVVRLETVVGGLGEDEVVVDAVFLRRPVVRVD